MLPPYFRPVSKHDKHLSLLAWLVSGCSLVVVVADANSVNSLCLYLSYLSHLCVVLLECVCVVLNRFPGMLGTHKMSLEGVGFRLFVSP